jgi:hypothetical protein
VRIKDAMRTICSTTTRADDVVAIHFNSVSYSPAALSTPLFVLRAAAAAVESAGNYLIAGLFNPPHIIHPADMLLLPGSSCYSNTLLCLLWGRWR